MDLSYYYTSDSESQNLDQDPSSRPMFFQQNRKHDDENSDIYYGSDDDNHGPPVLPDENFNKSSIEQNPETYQKDEEKNFRDDQFQDGKFQTTCPNGRSQPHKKDNDIQQQIEQNKKNQTHCQAETTTHFPGQSKNVYKNLGRPFKEFAKKIIDENNIQTDQVWEEFLQSDNQKLTKNLLTKLLETDFGKHLGQQFFGNFQWAKQIVLENKSDIEMYFPFNMFKKKKKIGY